MLSSVMMPDVVEKEPRCQMRCPPVSLANVFVLLSKLARKKPLGAEHEVSDREVGQYFDEHVHVIAPQDPRAVIAEIPAIERVHCSSRHPAKIGRLASRV